MSILCKEKIIRIDQSEFDKLNYDIMKYSFELHNQLGCFGKEIVYKKELANICNSNGLEVKTEVPITVALNEFSKTYYIDALINDSVILELKATSGIAKQDRVQAINYLLLTNLKHGKIINFGSSSVEDEFVSTKLSFKNRKVESFDVINSNNLVEEIVEIVKSIIDDWGMFLSLELYKEAIFFFLGSKKQLLRNVDIIINKQVIAQQKMYLLDDETAIHISCIKKDFDYYRKHIYKLIKHTNLSQAVWINFNNKKVLIETIKK